jgi:hypothetical protein
MFANFLKRYGANVDMENLIGLGFEERKKLFDETCAHLTATIQTKMVILLDDIQTVRLKNLFDSDNVKTQLEKSICFKFDYIPRNMGPNISVIVCSDDEKDKLDSVVDKGYWHILRLGSFSSQDAKLFVQEYMCKYNKVDFFDILINSMCFRLSSY